MGISEKQLRKRLADNEQLSVVNAGALGAPAERALEQDYAGPVAQSIVLPLPPSANRYWRYDNGTVHVSEEAENYKAGVRWKARFEHMVVLDGDVAIYLHIYRAQKRGDLDNYAKVLCDALSGAAYHDDNQIVALHMWRHDDAKNPRVEVEVRRVERSA